MSAERPCLLDVNVLIALFDSAHVHHSAAQRWFEVEGKKGWRTCPVTENAFLRILSNPSYPNGPMAVTELAGRLEEFKTSGSCHAFWPESFSTSEWIARCGHPAPRTQQLTDAYLLKLSAAHGGVLATFDLRISPTLIGRSEDDLVEHIGI